jgi:predicted dehydrogenase
MNRGHLGYFLGESDVQVLAVCDVDTTRRTGAQKSVDEHYAQEKAGGQYQGCAAYADFRELIARPDIDAVVIATPDHWHTIPVIEACKAGKDIYCEKPLTLTIHEARLLIDAVRKHDRVFQTGSQQRSSQEFRLACELVRSGRIGKIKSVIVNVGAPSKWCDLPEEALEPGLDWNAWLGPAPERPYNSILSPRGIHDHFPAWRNYREYSGGMMTDWGAHHFDIAQWGLGMDESGPVEIIPPEDSTAEKGVRYVYDNGAEVIHGEGGGVTFVGETGEIVVNRGHLSSTPETIIKEPLGENDVHLYESPGHQRDWLNCVKSRKRPICDVEIGARSVTVCHLGNLAYWNHRRLKWDPKVWRFIGDDEANTWLDRPRRDPSQLPSESTDE